MTLRPTRQEGESTDQWQPDPSILPEGWGLKRLKYVSQINSSSVDKKSREGETEVELCNYTEVYNNEVIDRSFDFLDATAGDHEIQRFKLREGDILFTKDSEDWTDIGVPAFIAEDLPGVICGYHLFHCCPNEDLVLPKYLFWALKSRYVAFQLEGAATGVTRYGLTMQDVANTWIPHPPKEVQSKIADFLDQQTNCLDAIIKRNSELLELLNEKRITEIYYDCFGRRGDQILKETSTDWAPKIPDYWFETRLKFVSNEIIDCEHKTAPNDPDGDFFIIKTSNVRDGKLLLEDAEKTNEEVYKEWTQRGEPKPGDIIFTREAPVGEVGIVPEGENVLLGQRTVLIRPDRSQITTNYLSYMLQNPSIEWYSELMSQGSTVPHLNVSDIKDLPVFLPPIEERKDIVKRLNEIDHKITLAYNNIENSINLHQEKRRALITDAVTGQINLKQTELSYSQEEIA
ncbi:restriction endonuclease subunit S [Natrialbaceae archaeon A-CW3]